MDRKPFALVTGASQGIGKAIAFEFASRKHNVILHSLPGEGLADLCREIELSFGVNTYHFESDLTEANGPLSLFEYVKNTGKDIDILVNNAGIGYSGRTETLTVEQIDIMIFLNIRALTHLTYYFIPMLRVQKSSHILFISSFGIYFPVAFKSIYLATKSYVYYLSRALRSELKGTPVNICTVVPSAVLTNVNTLKRIKQSVLSKMSCLSPEEVARVSLKGMFKGRSVIIPGKLTSSFFLCGMFVPVGFLLLLTRRIFYDTT
jgi:short-subunit dehydrogenase